MTMPHQKAGNRVLYRRHTQARKEWGGGGHSWGPEPVGIGMRVEVLILGAQN